MNTRNVNKSRPVHYASAGRKGLYFACYVREIQRHLESRRIIPPQGDFTRDAEGRIHVKAGGQYVGERIEYDIPPPQSRTKLTAVTCRECWVDIMALARQRGVR